MYLQWGIEKAYNNSKSNLKEIKAWSSSVKSLNNQMRLTTMTYNLMRVCEEISKIQDPALIHPSDKKYTKALEKRQKIAKENGRFVRPYGRAHGSISSWVGGNMGTLMFDIV